MPTLLQKASNSFLSDESNLAVNVVVICITSEYIITHLQLCEYHLIEMEKIKNPQPMYQ